MKCTLKGYSQLIQGKGRTIKHQYNQMFIFYYGQKSHRPIQIKMLCDGTATYHDLYSSSQIVVTSKSIDQSTTSLLTLKPSLSRDLNSNYHARHEITAHALEKKTVNAHLLVTRQSLRAIVKKEVTFYRKSLSYATNKWDLKKNEPKEYGTTTEDIIEYICREMYKDLHELEMDDNNSGKVDDYNKVDDISVDNIEDEDMYNADTNEKNLGMESII